MQTNEYGQQYVGNDDYRGWLSAMAANGDLYAKSLLRSVGNDGNVSMDRSEYNRYHLGSPKRDIVGEYYDKWLSGRPGQPQSPGDYIAGSGSGSTSAYDKQAVDYWNSAIDRYQNKLNGLNGLLDSLNAKTNDEFNTRSNELQGSYDRSESEYNQGSRQNSQQLQTNKNTIADRASQGLRGLLRTLGAMGAGGSSAALYNAPELVTAQANQERTGANQTFGENQQKLDTNWNNFKLDWENDKKKLDDWRQGQYRQNEQNVLDQRNSILGSMVDAYAQRGAAGQGAGNKINELTDQMKANDNRLNELNQFAKPSYDGTRATYKAPSLSSYNTGASSITTEVSNAPENGFSAKTSPTLAMLLGVKNRKNSNPYGRE